MKVGQKEEAGAYGSSETVRITGKTLLAMSMNSSVAKRKETRRLSSVRRLETSSVSSVCRRRDGTY